MIVGGDLGRLVVALKEIVLDYSPSAHLLKRVIKQRQRLDSSIVRLRKRDEEVEIA